MSFKRKVKRANAIKNIKKEYGRIFCPKCHKKMILKDNIPMCDNCGWFKKDKEDK